jgi:hypothetical protein
MNNSKNISKLFTKFKSIYDKIQNITGDPGLHYPVPVIKNKAETTTDR